MDDLNRHDGMQRVSTALVAIEKKGTSIANSTWKNKLVSLEQSSGSRPCESFVLCFREHGSLSLSVSRSPFHRSNSVSMAQIFAISTKSCEYGIEFIIPIIQIMTADKVYYLKMSTIPQLRGWVAALKAAVATSANVPSEQTLYHLLIPPNQAIREGDCLFRFHRESSPPTATFEDPVTTKAIRKVDLSSIVSFGTIMKYNQGWMQFVAEAEDGGANQDKGTGGDIRIYFQCSMLVTFTITLKANLEKTVGSSFLRRSNTFQVEYSCAEDDQAPESTDAAAATELRGTYTKKKPMFIACTSFESPWSQYQVSSGSSSEEDPGPAAGNRASLVVPKVMALGQDEPCMFSSDDDDGVVTFRKSQGGSSGQASYEYHTYQKLNMFLANDSEEHRNSGTLTSSDSMSSPLMSPSTSSTSLRTLYSQEKDRHREDGPAPPVPTRKVNLQRHRHRYVNDPLPGKQSRREIWSQKRLSNLSEVFIDDRDPQPVKIQSNVFRFRHPSFEVENVNEVISRTPSPNTLSTGQRVSLTAQQETPENVFGKNLKRRSLVDKDTESEYIVMRAWTPPGRESVGKGSVSASDDTAKAPTNPLASTAIANSSSACNRQLPKLTEASGFHSVKNDRGHVRLSSSPPPLSPSSTRFLNVEMMHWTLRSSSASPNYFSDASDDNMCQNSRPQPPASNSMTLPPSNPDHAPSQCPNSSAEPKAVSDNGCPANLDQKSDHSQSAPQSTAENTQRLSDGNAPDRTQSLARKGAMRRRTSNLEGGMQSTDTPSEHADRERQLSDSWDTKQLFEHLLKTEQHIWV